MGTILQSGPKNLRPDRNFSVQSGLDQKLQSGPASLLLKTPCILVSHISNFSCLLVSEPFPSNGIGSFALCFLSRGSVGKGGLVSGFVLWLAKIGRASCREGVEISVGEGAVRRRYGIV